MKGYGFFYILILLFSKIITFIFFNKCRLIRLPIYIKGKKYISLGQGMTIGVGARIEAYPSANNTCIFFGKNIQINDYVHIGSTCQIIIGNNVLIASRVYISDHNHGEYKNSDPLSGPNVIPQDRPIYGQKIMIEDNVWIGEAVCILAGVTIGSGAIIGAGSVVTKSIPKNSIAVGNPAKVIKIYNFDTSSWKPVDE